MKASGFEFRYRSSLIGLLYGIGFSACGYDHIPAVEAMASWVLGPSSAHAVLRAPKAA